MFHISLLKEEGDCIPWQGLSLVTGRPCASGRIGAPVCPHVKGEPFPDIQLGRLTYPFGYP